MSTSSTFNLENVAVKKITLPTVKQYELEDVSLFDQCDLVVFSHLRWEFVVQRPQHIISRLSKGRKVLFVEEQIPRPVGKQNGVGRVFHPTRNITVLQPYMGNSGQDTSWHGAVGALMNKMKIINPVLWFFSPAFLSVITEIKDRSLVVYDCLDELTAFKGAPKALREQERALVSYCDLIFTGGKSLYEAKKDMHKNVFCFPSSVDQRHFRKSLRVTTKIPADLASIPSPRAGFYGVLDERFSPELLKNIAELMPEVSFVIIGPVVKISQNDLPVAPNIHYLGERHYRSLPNYLKGLNVMVMPFALNEATRFISPTKTLEFMAARKPIVCTPIHDVVRDYTQEVYIAKNAQEFKTAIDYYLHEPALDRQVRYKRQQHVLEQTSWDKTVADMKYLMNEALKAKMNQS